MDTGPNAATEMLIDEGPDTPDEPRDPIDDLTSRINNKYVLLYYCIIYIFKFIAPVYKIEVQWFQLFGWRNRCEILKDQKRPNAKDGSSILLAMMIWWVNLAAPEPGPSVHFLPLTSWDRSFILVTATEGAFWVISYFFAIMQILYR